MITRGNSFKLLLYYIFLEDPKYMTILTRQERERLVIDLYYNQGKTYREIAEIEHISPRDIRAIIKQEETGRQKYKDQQQQEELSAQAYELFSTF
jgi:transposase